MLRNLPLPLPGRRRSAPERLDGLRVLVTGGASGLGLELVRQYSARGAVVVAADLAPVDDPPSALPDGVRYLRLDVRSEQEWIDARDEIESGLGGLDLLVNNAGIAQGGRIHKLTAHDWDHILDVNVLGVVRGCRVFTPMLIEQGSGHVLNVASLAGLVHPPAMSSYTAAKAAVVALSESMRWELEPLGVGVSVLCPAFFKTALADSLNASDPEISGVAGKLINRSSTTPDTVAREAIRGVAENRFLILPDRDARIPYESKKFAPVLYAKNMRDMATRFLAVAAKNENEEESPR